MEQSDDKFNINYPENTTNEYFENNTFTQHHINKTSNHQNLANSNLMSEKNSVNLNNLNTNL